MKSSSWKPVEHILTCSFSKPDDLYVDLHKFFFMMQILHHKNFIQVYSGNIFNEMNCFAVCFMPFYEKGCLGCLNNMAETALNSKFAASRYLASEPGGLCCPGMPRSTLLCSLRCSFWGYVMTDKPWLGLSFPDDCLCACRAVWMTQSH